MPINDQMINRFKELIPKLNSDLHKGQSGRVGIVGGSREYTGAPFFSAISSLRTGADISYVLSTEDASQIIKSFSPNMIVLPILKGTENAEQDMRPWIEKMHSLIIGPGLGRSELAFKYVKIALNLAISRNIPVVVDADGLYIMSYNMSLFEGYKKCILTPNFMEFKRLYEEAFKEEYDELKEFQNLENQCRAVKRLANKLDNLTIVKKGKIDIISDGNELIINEMNGSLKRCGGIGDLLAGSIGTFTHWAHVGIDQEIKTMICKTDSSALDKPCIIASYAATTLIKQCSLKAFEKFHRSVLADDILQEIPNQFYQLFDKPNS